MGTRQKLERKTVKVGTIEIGERDRDTEIERQIEKVRQIQRERDRQGGRERQADTKRDTEREGRERQREIMTQILMCGRKMMISYIIIQYLRSGLVLLFHRHNIYSRDYTQPPTNKLNTK